jgi:Predicted heme/steroid binding protein
MKNKHGLKIGISIASLAILFLAIYQFTFASTFGGSTLFQSDQSPVVGKLVAEKVATNNVDSVTTATVPNEGSQASSTPPSQASSNTGLITLAQTSTVPQTWTLETLSKYNGMNGNPAYIAVNGTIYNVTSIGSWSGGVHHGIRAGQDVTTFFASSPHSASLLNQVPVIGKIGDPIANNAGSQSPANDATTSATTVTGSSSNEGHDYDSEDDDHEAYDDDHDKYDNHKDDDKYDDHDDHDDDHEDGDD